MTANGFSKRRFRVRSRSTAASDTASQARWYPPIPLTATISPRPRAACAAARAASEPCTEPPSPCSNQRRGPQSGAGHRLRVEAAVRRVVVLRGAGVTQGERLHGRVRAVVGEADRDGEARTAVRAIDERVARPAVGGVEELVETVGAGRDVRRHERPDSALIVALDDGETRLAGRCEVLALDRGDAGRPGRTGHQPGHELVCRRAVALDFDEHALGVVADVAGQAELGGEPVDVRPEPDPLDQPGHAETEANHCPRRGQAGHAGEPLRRPRVTAASRCIRPKL